MKKALLSKFMAVLLVAVTVTAGCIESNDKDNEDDKESFHTTSSDFNIGMNEFVNSSNEFTFDMYKQLIFLDDNIFFSPYSISTALGMAYEGARGKTAAEILEVFDFPEDNQSRWDMVKDVQNTFNKEVTLYELSTANAYWLVEGGHLKQMYKDIIESYYLAHGKELDFTGDPEGSVEIINSWVENRTNNKIKDLLSINDIDGLTYLILTNAIYFKSDWKYQFDSKATDERDFTLSNKDHIKVDTMHMCDESKKLNYTSNSEVQLLQLPYKDDELSMYILLPIDNDITSIETELSFNYLTKLKEKLNAEWVDLYLPKFKLEQKYDLKENLSDMGMPTAFGPAADFSGITSDTWLYIYKVIHQSFVEVDEKGTEAAAATAVIFKNDSSSTPNKKPIEFKADHPFISFIEHRDTGQILFMGKVEDPSV